MKLAKKTEYHYKNFYENLTFFGGLRHFFTAEQWCMCAMHRNILAKSGLNNTPRCQSVCSIEVVLFTQNQHCKYI